MSEARARVARTEGDARLRRYLGRPETPALAFLILLVVAFSVLSDEFLRVPNLESILTSVAVLGNRVDEACDIVDALPFALTGGLFSRSPANIEKVKMTMDVGNFYINRNFTNPNNAQGKAEEWTQSFILDAKSGFTQGTVGFGLDVLGMYAVKLDGGGEAE